MTVLASGSKGNSTVIASSRTRLLVDAGLSCRELLRRMAIAGEDPATLDAILITHEHLDHVAGLAVLARRLRIPVFFTESTHRAWVRMLTPRTTMSYAKWLDHLQQEKAARASALAIETANLLAGEGSGGEVSLVDGCAPDAALRPTGTALRPTDTVLRPTNTVLRSDDMGAGLELPLDASAEADTVTDADDCDAEALDKLAPSVKADPTLPACGRVLQGGKRTSRLATSP